MKKIGVEEHMFKGADVLIPERLRDMDENGVDMQVLSFSIEHGEATLGAAEAAARTRQINDELAEIVAKYPERFAAFAAITPQDPEASAVELERAVTQLGLKGVLTGPDMRGNFFDEPKFGVLLETAEKLDVPLYLHPNAPPLDMIKPYADYPMLIGAMWGFSAEAGLHAMRLICSGAFDKYPRLKIMLGHMGEGIPYYLWRIDNQWEKATKQPGPGSIIGEYADKSGVTYCQRKPSEYFKNNCYVTTSGMFWHPSLQFAISVLGSDRILFAADYPLESIIEASRFIESAPISDGDKEQICHLNAEKLLKL